MNRTIDMLINVVRRTLISIALLGGLVLAIDYQVDGEGGPPNLADAVVAAFSVWRGVEGANVEANLVEEGGNLIRYGGGDDFGPETYSLTVQRTEDDARRVNVLLNPALEPQNDLRRRALLHETGVLLGLNALSGEDQGVMNPAFPAGAAANLSEADRTAIAGLESFAAEDVNRDGAVDFYDLAVLAASFGQSGVTLEGDINEDGVVDDADVARLREAYVFGEPAETDPNSGGEETGGGTGGEFDEDEFEEDEDLEDEDLEEFGEEGDVTGGAETGGAPEGDAEEGPGGEVEEDVIGGSDGSDSQDDSETGGDE